MDRSTPFWREAFGYEHPFDAGRDRFSQGRSRRRTRGEIVDAPIGGISVVVFIISIYVPSIVQGVFVGSGTEAAKHPNWRRASHLIIKPSGPGSLVTSMAVTTPAQLATRE
ncbi:hypothetical protein [Bradyrhizobium sp. USDA 4506]